MYMYIWLCNVPLRVYSEIKCCILCHIVCVYCFSLNGMRYIFNNTQLLYITSTHYKTRQSVGKNSLLNATKSTFQH